MVWVGKNPRRDTGCFVFELSGLLSGFDGYMFWKAFKVAYKQMVTRDLTASQWRLRIIEIFKKFDANNDGVISKQAW